MPEEGSTVQVIQFWEKLSYGETAEADSGKPQRSKPRTELARSRNHSTAPEIVWTIDLIRTDLWLALDLQLYFYTNTVLYENCCYVTFF